MDSVQKEGVAEPLLGPTKQKPPEAAEHVSSELEEILSRWRRLHKALAIEFRYLFRLAGPAVISMSTQIFCGHLGNLELAASSLGNNGIQLLAYGLMLGMGSSVETLCGQAYGAHKFDMLGIYMQRSVVLLMATGIPLALIYIFSKQILRARTFRQPLLWSTLALYVFGWGLVLSLSWWIIVFVYILTSERCKLTWNGFSWMAFSAAPL